MPAVNRETILAAVRQLPPAEQRKLAYEILQAATPGSLTPASPRREPPTAPDPHLASAMALRGVAKTATPIDDALHLDESRMERYG